MRLYASLAYFFIRLLRSFVIPAKLVPYLIRERESRTYKIVILSEAKNLGEEWAKGSVTLPPAPIVIPAKAGIQTFLSFPGGTNQVRNDILVDVSISKYLIRLY